MADGKREKSTRLRKVLARYRGGRFETDGGGGAGGMMFFRNGDGALFYIGGFNPKDAAQIATALNLVLELLESGGSDAGAPRTAARPTARSGVS